MVDQPLPITEHLAELRGRIAKSLLAWGIGTTFAWGFKEQIFGFLLAPAVDALGDGSKLQAIAPTEIFFTYMKCALLAGFMLALPVVFWQVWAFVAPGLYANEKRAIVPFVLSSSILFIGGSVFGYNFIFPLMFAFFTGFDSEWVVSAWTMREVFSLTSRMFLVFGAAFELPLFIFFLSLSGIVGVPQLVRATPYAVLAIFIVAAILTPPDPISQILLAVPLLGLYLLGVGVAWLFHGRAKAAAAVPGQHESEIAKSGTEIAKSGTEIAKS